MKLIHTSDWHFGMNLGTGSYAEDQRYFLDRLYELIQREQAEAVLLAGDIYDSSVVNAEAIELYNEAIRTAKRQEPYFQQLLAGIVNHLLGLMFMTNCNNHLQPDDEQLKKINRARAFLQESVEAEITMPEVAEYLNMSYTTFRHAFKKYTGLSPAQYFINLKLHRAKEMLRSTTASIKEISYMLHFESPEYFATVFRKKIGTSPSEFRNT